MTMLRRQRQKLEILITTNTISNTKPTHNFQNTIKHVMIRGQTMMHPTETITQLISRHSSDYTK